MGAYDCNNNIMRHIKANTSCQHISGKARVNAKHVDEMWQCHDGDMHERHQASKHLVQSLEPEAEYTQHKLALSAMNCTLTSQH